MNQQLTLIEHLKERGVSQDNLERMQKERIDENTVPDLSEDELSVYLPLKGDRVAAQQFCKRQRGKETLIDRLRSKFQGDNQSKKQQIRMNLKGNLHAAKSSRVVELGWYCYCKNRGKYVQVRSPCGGGTRIVEFNKQDTAKYVLEKSKSLFFPNGSSKTKGNALNYDFELRDFDEISVDETSTIAELYDKCHLRTMRLYVFTKRLDSQADNAEDLPPAPKRLKRTRRKIMPSDIRDEINSDNETVANHDGINQVTQVTNEHHTGTFHYKDQDISFNVDLGDYEETVNTQYTNTGAVSELGTVAFADIGGVDLLNSALTTAQLQTFSNSYPIATSVPLDNFNPVQQPPFASSPVTNQQPNIQSPSPAARETTRSQLLPEPEATHSFDSFTGLQGDPVNLTIHGGPIAFQEVLGYFKDETIVYKPLKIKRILPNGDLEQAEDSGGVLRDLISEFWDSFYDMATIGRDTKVPSIRHDFGATEWEAVGRVLAFGYQVTDYWPVGLSKTFLLQCIRPDDEINNDNLLRDFYHFVSKDDMEVFQRAFEDFNSVGFDDLIDSLDSYDCKTSPNQENIKSIILEIAHTTIIQKPMYICNSMKAVVSALNISNEKVDEIYSNLVPTNRKVVKMLQFPTGMDAQEQEVAKHLQQYVKNLDEVKLKHFLRYCTGSDLLTMKNISIEFCVMIGLARRPVAHTCTYMLQLSKTYESFMALRSEFDNVLTQNVWVMDGT